MGAMGHRMKLVKSDTPEVVETWCFTMFHPETNTQIEIDSFQMVSMVGPFPDMWELHLPPTHAGHAPLRRNPGERCKLSQREAKGDKRWLISPLLLTIGPIGQDLLLSRTS